MKRSGLSSPAQKGWLWTGLLYRGGAGRGGAGPVSWKGVESLWAGACVLLRLRYRVPPSWIDCNFCTHPHRAEVPLQPFSPINAGLKYRVKVSALCLYQQMKLDGAQRKRRKKGSTILLPSFYLYFLGLVNGLSR